MDDLDKALARLAGAPVPAGLNDIEHRIIARLATGAGTRNAGAGIGIGAVMIAALVIGVMGAELPTAAGSTDTLAPLGGGSPLTPSALLIGDELLPRDGSSSASCWRSRRRSGGKAPRQLIHRHPLPEQPWH